MQGAQASAQNPNDILQAQNTQFGVPQAQQTVTGLRGAINNTTALLKQVAPSVMGRTGSSLVTNAQATRQIANESAPIQQKLSEEGTNLNTAQQDLATQEQQAEKAATGIYQGQQDKLSYLQNLYNSLYGQEQDAAKLAEQKREADMNAKAQSDYLASLNPSNTNATPTAPKAFSAFKNGQNGAAGTNFTDTNGQAISAAKYAQLTGTDIGTLLQKMGAGGDRYAQQAYNEIANNKAFYQANPDILKQEFGALFWGT